MADGRFPRTYQPARHEIDELIRQARNHPLGTDFLLNGCADAVAATFQVHGFVVDSARDALAAPPPVVQVPLRGVRLGT